ncbi:MAG: class II fumarate hydratase [Candidatus Nanopelagicales bacterium]
MSQRPLWGQQTELAIDNFPISGETMPPEFLKAMAQIKAEAALVNAALGVLDASMADAISDAAEQVIAGDHHDAFPLDVFQTGSGTSSNMNMNEVLATLAERTLGRPVHPNDHVNASQSSNDTVPTAIALAATDAIVHRLMPALWHLHGALERKGLEYADAVKAGRTHLVDAVPVTLGQELHGHAAQVARSVERLESTLPRLAEVPLGGTAAGTGINMPAGFAAAVIERLADRTGLPLVEARNHMEGNAARDAMVETSGQLRVLAVALTKICNDLRWMSSGPRAGLAEIRLPELQKGSSIMPGKVNPVIPEAVLMVCTQVVGNDTAIAWAGASGSFELNVQMPVIARNLLEQIRLLTNATRLLADRCIEGFEADVDRMREYAEGTTALATALNPYLGYEEAAEIAKHALKSRTSIRAATEARGHLESGRLDAETLDRVLDPLRLTRPPGRREPPLA